MASIKTGLVLPALATLFVVGSGAAVYASLTNDKPLQMVGGSDRDKPVITSIDADSTADTLRTVTSQFKEQKASNDALIRKNEELQANLQRSMEREAERQAQIQSAINTALASKEAQDNATKGQLEQQLASVASMMKSMSGEVESLKADARNLVSSSADQAGTVIPDFGVETTGFGFRPSSGTVVDSQTLMDAVWINPIDRPAPIAGSGGSPGSSNFTPLSSQTSGSGSGLSTIQNVRQNLSAGSLITAKAAAPVEDHRYFTLPDLSALTGGISTTSLIGKVYTGEIKDPWPFKIQVARANLTANFRDLPSEIEGMIFEGFAVGDWSLSCVKGHILAATFVFEDGTVSTTYGTDTASRPKEANTIENTIGYISDDYGNPCIKGAKHSDVGRYVGQRFLAGAIEGYAGALADAETTRQENVNNDGSTSLTRTVTGDIEKFASANAVRNGAEDLSEVVRERHQQVTDLIYAPSGSRVSVHLQQEIHIDKRPNARKVRYSRGEYVNATLD